MASFCLGIEALFPHVAVAQEWSPYLPPIASMVVGTETAKPVRLPESELRQARRRLHVTTTAYSSTPDQTDSTPFITASGSHVRRGVVAANFLPFGTQLRLPEYYGDDVFVVEDRMNQRYDVRLDVWMETREQAKQWGVRYVEIEIL